MSVIMKSASDGCESSVFAASSPSMRNLSGAYLVHCRPSTHNALADDAALGTKLWEWSVTLTDGMR